jgi:hypothetical protein
VWGDFRSRRFHLLIPLPDGKAWRIDDHTSQWLSATHPASQSELLVRVWRDADRMNRTRCEAQARLWRPLPERAGTDIVATRRVNVPPEHDTTVEVGVSAEQPGKPLHGFAMAFGGWSHGCFAYVYTTRATGDSVARVLSERLAAMVDGSLSKIVVASDLEPVIPKEPVP